MPQVWNAPTEIDSIEAVPVLEVGSNRSVVVPSPICAETLSPVQNTVPFTRTTQLWLPAATATTSDVSMPLGEFTTVTVLLLIPSWPVLLRPQHSTSPSNARAQVLNEAAANATTPVRAVGVGVLNSRRARRGAVGRRQVAELAELVVAPALHAAPAAQHAGMERARSNGHDIVQSWHGYRRKPR